MVICLKQGANDLHMVQRMSLPLSISYFGKTWNGSAFLVKAYPGCLGKEAVKWVLFRCCYCFLIAVCRCS